MCLLLKIVRPCGSTTQTPSGTATTIRCQSSSWVIMQEPGGMRPARCQQQSPQPSGNCPCPGRPQCETDGNTHP